MHVYERLTGRPRTPTLAGGSVLFSRDGRFLLTGQRLWETATGLQVSPPLPCNEFQGPPTVLIDGRGVVIPWWHADGSRRLLAVDFVAREDDATLLRRADLAAGSPQIDEAGAVVPLRPEEFVPVPEATALERHRRTEDLARAAGDWTRMLVHLDRQRLLGATDLTGRIREARLWSTGSRSISPALPSAPRWSTAACSATTPRQRRPVPRPTTPRAPPCAWPPVTTARRRWPPANRRSCVTRPRSRWSRNSGTCHRPQDRAHVGRTLRRWQADPDLASVRGNAVAKLPDAERGRWEKVWADVAALLAAFGGKP